MSSEFGPQGTGENASIEEDSLASRQTMECQLFESMIHQLVEKGVMTRNDALSVVQTVAEVKRTQIEEGGPRAAAFENELTFLNRLYSSFELLRDQLIPPQVMDGENVIQLRSPLHGNSPEFPSDF